MWTVGKSKELEEVRFSSVNPEEVYWVGLVGREAGDRMGGCSSRGTEAGSMIPSVVEPGPGQGDRGQMLRCQPPSLLSTF